ncbi:MAG: helix-turn-helix transcriptional regulator [Proteobacteria bacterium]|nr:helix-turn-helix transcriptional regulator [Pseudomonadota bacterium]
MPKRPTTSIDVHIGRRVHELRKAHGLSQKALAEKLAVSYQQIQKYEKGTNRAALSTLLEIARLMKISPAYFFEEIEAFKDLAPIAMANFTANSVAARRNTSKAAQAEAAEIQTLIGAYLAIRDPAARRKALLHLASLSKI